MPGSSKPGWLWLIFFGRRRRGFPWLLAAALVIPLALALTYAAPSGVSISHWVGIAFVVIIAALLMGALCLILLSGRRPPGRR